MHIGSPKAGSTTIQSFLAQNAGLLAERGVRYAMFGQKAHYHANYAIAALARQGESIPDKNAIARRNLTPRKRARITSDVNELLNGLAKDESDDLFVISSEHIAAWLRSAADVRALDSLLRQAFTAVTYVVYLRDPRAQVLSQFSQRTKAAGNALPFDKFLRKRAGHSQQIDLVDLWTNALGADALLVRLLDVSVMVDGDLCSDFCDLMGVTTAGMTIPARENEALSALALECIRRLNATVPLVVDGRPNRARSRMVAEIKRAHNTGAPMALTPKQQAWIERKTAQSNEAIRQRYFPAHDTLYGAYQPRDPVDFEAVQAQADAIVTDLLRRMTQGEFEEVDA